MLAILTVEVTEAMKRGRVIDGRAYDDHGAHIGHIERAATEGRLWRALDADGTLLKVCHSKAAAVLAVLENTCSWGSRTGWMRTTRR